MQAAVEALADPERFRDAERLVTSAAPALQRVLNEALAAGGWFDESREKTLADAIRGADEEQRVAHVRTLFAEESRLAMMIGVAVGWTLANELADSDTTETEPKERTDP